MLIETYGTDQFNNLFGMSEMGPTGCLLRPEDQLRKAGSVGRTAMIGNAMRVVKADGTEAGPGGTEGTARVSVLCGMGGLGPSGCLLRPEGQLRRAGSVGRRAMIGDAMRVVKADGTEAGRGETGEIWFSGDTRMREYLGNPEATAA